MRQKLTGLQEEEETLTRLAQERADPAAGQEEPGGTQEHISQLHLPQSTACVISNGRVHTFSGSPRALTETGHVLATKHTMAHSKQQKPSTTSIK